jgi:ribosomal protein S18 acetylase RimI-like enzyme
VTIVPLSLADIEVMAPRWQDSFDLDEVWRVVTRYPDRSVWAPETGEVAIVGDWRRRPEIGSILGFHAIRHARELIQAAAERCRDAEIKALLSVEWHERQHPAFYEAIGFELLDSVISLELMPARTDSRARPTMEATRLNGAGRNLVEALIAVDHAAFSWLWINSADEFAHYMTNPEVELWGHVVDGRLVSYVGLTTYGRWGHLDRLAVHPDFQHRGLGTDLTCIAVDRLRALGAATVGLSTQDGNWKSQRLYQQLGFRRSDQNSYRVYGMIFAH